MTVLRVVVTRTGGFAGIRLTREFDDPQEAARLADAARAASGGPADDRVRDGFEYEFAIDTTDGAERVTVRGGLPPEVRGLLDRG